MDLRPQKALEIFNSNGIKKIENNYAVRSQSKNKYYFVDRAFNCNCPDYEERKPKPCKHSQAVKYFLQIERPKKYTEQIRISRPQAWSAYNQAQQSELKLFDELLKDLVADIKEEQYTFGRPRLSRKEIVFCSIQKVYSRLSSRRAKSLFNRSMQEGKLKHSPNFNAVSKLLKQHSTTPLLQRLLVKTAEPLKAVETKFAIDSSGFRTTNFNEYCKDKHLIPKRHSYLKAHICIGVKTNIITGAIVTTGYVGDSPQLQKLVEQTSKNFKAIEYSADKAYSGKKNVELITEQGATPLIPFRNETVTGRGVTSWRKLYHYFCFNREEFMQRYHLRSNVETTFAMIKAKLGDSLKSKNFVAQKNELLCKLIAHNIIVLIQEMHELEIEAKFK